MARNRTSRHPSSSTPVDGASPSAAAPADAPAQSSADVIVVGAGPTGLLLAGDLAAAGHHVTLVERRAEEIGSLSRALVVHARTLEQLDARGLADELVERGQRVGRMRLFGGAALLPSRLPSRFPFVLVAGQFEVERVLLRRAREAGVAFRYGTEMAGLRQDSGGVELTVRATEQEGREQRAFPEGRTESLRASYLVGTDGVHSTVREALGLPFPGRAAIRSIVLADVRMSEPPSAPFTADATGDAFALVGSFGDGWHRVAGWDRRRQLPDSAPVDLDEVRRLARDVFGTDFGLHSPRWMSRFHSDERQAPHYRVGRSFLAGDAAHAHSPAGGMGMNTGLQDAANLSWKLSAVLHGQAPASLLDSYEQERHPVGAQVLRISGGILRAGLTGYGPLRRMRALAAKALTSATPLADRAIRAVSGLAVSYPAPRGAHPLTGRRAPDLALTSGRLYEALREGTFVLVVPAGGARPALSDPSRVVCAESRRDPKRTLLIRPDGYIAWASDAPDQAGLRRALEEWTAPPIPVRHALATSGTR